MTGWLRKGQSHVELVQWVCCVENSGGPNRHHNKAAPTANNKLRKHMPANTEHPTSHTKTGSARTYPSELQPLRQSLVVALAKLDFELQSDIETIRNSSVDQWMKQQTIKTLQEHHQQRRTSYIRQLASWQRQAQALAA